jgi:hypothetical protein
MLQFGDTDDMLLFWGASLDSRKSVDSTEDNSIAFAKNRICEVYLVTEFLKSLGREIHWSLRDSWDVFADHFCIVDQQALDLYWPKYNRAMESRYKAYDTLRTSQELSFLEWLNLYSDRHWQKNVPEEALFEPFGAPIRPPTQSR